MHVSVGIDPDDKRDVIVSSCGTSSDTVFFSAPGGAILDHLRVW